MGKINKHSIVSYSLRRKLFISVALMSILPLLVCVYLVSNYILPKIGLKVDITSITASVIISILIATIGFFVIKEIFDRIISVSTEAKLIASGDISHIVKVAREDEIGYLGEALNELTRRIRSNMDELRNYGERTSEINLQIQRRVLVLSSLLQISSLISQGVKLEDILKLTTEKSRLLANSDIAYLLFREEDADEFYMKAVDGINSQDLLQIRLKSEESIFNRLVGTNKPLILDKENVSSKELTKAFYEQFRLKNTLAIPVYLRGKVMGVLAIGNTKEQFLYGKDDMELLDIFAKQVAIAVENDLLMHRVEKLEIKDALTGLYNEAFIRSRLQEEIKRAIAYRRPCSFILLNIDSFQKFQQNFGSLQAENILKRIATLVKDSVTEIDRVARFGDNEFAIVLPEKNKRQARETAEDIRKKIEFTFSEEQDIDKRLTVSGSVSENPLDGVEAQELILKAKELINLAKKQGKNCIAI